MNRRYLYEATGFGPDVIDLWGRLGPRRLTHPFLTHPWLPAVMKAGDTRGHILDGEALSSRKGGHRWNSRRPGKTTFPREWSDDDVMDACARVVLDPSHIRAYERSGDVAYLREVSGVIIMVTIRAGGAFDRAFPISGNGVMRNSPSDTSPSRAPVPFDRGRLAEFTPIGEVPESDWRR
ncbi:hypothetical protein AXK61_22680 [Tsukamurella pseudospumae]|uniref:Bacterial EndoU nuclease domain-containing protein n=2 Tax=Tsukamurella pseudospumae TaxID=239498 RepID=A0A137ZDS5_9ACTN|nr:hypothetical protein AXK61_22680 [Tsukamurella pseudospumae]